MPDLPPDIEQHLADMSEADWDVLVSKIRSPNNAEAFRDVASKYIDGDRLESICKVANISQFVGDDGQIDRGKVERSLRAVFGIPAGPRHPNFGQFTDQPDMGGPGDRGQAEAHKRFSGAKAPARVSAEAQRRFHQNGGAQK